MSEFDTKITVEPSCSVCGFALELRIEMSDEEILICPNGHSCGTYADLKVKAVKAAQNWALDQIGDAFKDFS